MLYILKFNVNNNSIALILRGIWLILMAFECQVAMGTKALLPSPAALEVARPFPLLCNPSFFLGYLSMQDKKKPEPAEPTAPALVKVHLRDFNFNINQTNWYVSCVYIFHCVYIYICW